MHTRHVSNVHITPNIYQNPASFSNAILFHAQAAGWFRHSACINLAL